MPFIIPNQTSTALLRPITTSGWTRPVDWITITDTPGEVQFLMSDATSPFTAINTIFTQTGGVGNIYIDWGDGTTDTISTTGSTSTNHTYTSGGTASSLGYNMWKIRVYGDAGTTLTNTSIVWNTNQTTLYTTSPSGLLEAVYGDGTQTSGFSLLFYNGLTPVPYLTYLTYVKLPSVINTAGTIFDFTFALCYNLRKVVMPISAPNATSLSGCFYFNYNLSEPIILPQDATLITTLDATFRDCNLLTSITLPPTLNNLTTLNNTFFQCYSLTQIQVPPTPLCLTFNSTFNSCRSLLSYEFKEFPTTPGTINLSSMFSSCVSLEYIKLPATTSGNNITFGNTFTSCLALKNIVLPSIFNASSMTSAFQNCSSLSSVVFPTTMSGLTFMSSTFSSCNNLQQITLPTSVGATINLQNAFQNCWSLSEITIPSSYNITTLQATFSTCVNLRKITLPATLNSLTTMAQMSQNCNNLQSIVMPTSMTSLTNIDSALQGCRNLQSVSFPSSLNLVTSMANTLNSCNNLVSITLPTSMTSLTAVNSIVQNCWALKSIVMPATTGNITNYGSSFASCFSLNNITLPTTPSTNLAVLGTTFNLDFSLTGITNTQFLGNSGTTGTIYVDFSSAQVYQLPTLDMRCKFSRFVLTGLVGNLTKLTSLRLRNSGSGQYAGSSPQIDISYNGLGQAALVQVFTDLPTIVSKTINITGCSGAAALTAPERAIATGKGWTITG